MHRVFNCGIGLVLVVDRDAAQAAIERLATLGEAAYAIGTRRAAKIRRARHRRHLAATRHETAGHPDLRPRLEHDARFSTRSATARSLAQVMAVISNRPDAAGLAIAADRGHSDRVSIDHRAYPDRDAFENALAAAIDAHAPDLIVLAGFMRILSEAFVDRYAGRMINIHPSLLPTYPGARHAHAARLPTGSEFTAARCIS